MYVCLCRGVTDRQIRRAVDQGACSLAQVQCKLSVADCCGRCVPMTRQIIREQRQDTPLGPIERSAALPSAA